MLRFYVYLAVVGSVVTSAQTAFQIKEKLVVPPPGWTRLAPAAQLDHTIALRIALPQQNFAGLEQVLYEVSDPTHPRYGQHLSKKDVENFVQPHPKSVKAVNEWVGSYGLRDTDVVCSAAGDWVTLNIPVALAETMLNTEYSLWKHEASGETIIRTTEYSLPAALHPHIELVQPTTMFARLHKMRTTFRWEDDQETAQTIGAVVDGQRVKSANAKGHVNSSCKHVVTLKCLRQLYNAVGYKPSKVRKNSVAVTGYLGEYANIADLTTFYADQHRDAMNSTFKFISVNGGRNDQKLSKAGAEAALDVQFAFGLTYPIPSTFYSTAGSPPFRPDLTTPTNTNEPYSEWLDYVLGHSKPPLVISTSYGDSEQTVPENYAKRVCGRFAELGARGVSLLFSSGDFGVGDGNNDPETQECLTNDGRNATRLLPAFPASCPFVTAVGGTTSFNPELSVGFSGGGFSNVFARPKYQDKAVTKFLSTLPAGLYMGLYNKNGRGLPDVAAQAQNFRISYRGRFGLIGGTSASAPAFAGLVALLNDARLSKGMKPLGFLNPFIYQFGVKGLTDIVGGESNSGCGTNGFNATVGWDPVTGYGTPNFYKLKSIALKKHN